MPCESMYYYREFLNDEDALAERGLSEVEIADLQARAELAREKAKAASFADGESLERQSERIEDAVDAAINDWHIEQHARLEADMKAIQAVGRLVKAHAGTAKS